MKRFLMMLFPGAENWLWRRIACLSSVGVILHSIEVATGKGDSATVGQLVIGLGVALGAYVGGAVTDDHLKRKIEAGSPT